MKRPITGRPRAGSRRAGATPADWREATLARVRGLILAAEPRMTEERKWKKPSNGMLGVPVWSRSGIVCTGEIYKEVVKLTFAHGASLPDPAGLFNAGLGGGTRRAIDIREGEFPNPRAFKALVRSAVARNEAQASAKKAPARGRATGRGARAPGPRRTHQGKVVLLSGGNPQIAKGDGDGPVQAYIAAMPGWKRDVGARLDALITRAVPGVRKAVKWNSPFYGVEGQGWFLSFHVFARYVKVAFFRGTSLRPLPPGPSKSEDTRYVDVHEGELNEAQMTAWVRQAARLPGWMA